MYGPAVERDVAGLLGSFAGLLAGASPAGVLL